MSTHDNAELLIAWLRERPCATVADIEVAGPMRSRTASDAVQYTLRSGALERIKRAGASAKDRVQYRATGVALPAPRPQSRPSFDGLLTAWGILLDPPQLQVAKSRRH